MPRPPCVAHGTRQTTWAWALEGQGQDQPLTHLPEHAVSPVSLDSSIEAVLPDLALPLAPLGSGPHAPMWLLLDSQCLEGR